MKIRWYKNILNLKSLKWGYSIRTSSSTEIKSKCLWWAAHVDWIGKQDTHAELLQLFKHGYLKHLADSLVTKVCVCTGKQQGVPHPVWGRKR